MTFLDPRLGRTKSEGLVYLGQLFRGWAHPCLQESEASSRAVLCRCGVVILTSSPGSLQSGSFFIPAHLLPWIGQERMFCSDYFCIKMVIKFGYLVGRLKCELKMGPVQTPLWRLALCPVILSPLGRYRRR